MSEKGKISSPSIDLNKLLNGIVKNDESSFRKLFELYYPLLHEFALYFVKSDQNAEEVVTDVFMKLWHKRLTILEIKNLQAYLFTATKRESLNYIRDNKLDKNLFVKLEDQLKITFVNPEYELLYSESLKIFSDSVNELPEKCRLIFQLVKEKGMKYKEVADLLNISEKAVEMHVSKALKRIYKALSEYGSVNISKQVATKVISFLIFYLSVI